MFFDSMKRTSFIKRAVAILVLVSAVGAGCTKGPDAATVAATKKVSLTVWGVVDDVDVYQKILSDYHKLHPYVDLQYRRFRLEEYENELLNALAEDRGPDVFLIHNTWVGKYMPKIQVMPPSTKVAIQVIQGTLKKEVVYQLNTDQSVTIKQYKQDYPDVVAQDLIRVVNVSTVADKKDLQQRVVAIPLSVDTLALYANKDLLNAAGIATIPQTWDDFQAAVKKLVKFDENGEITQAGASIGTGINIERSPDILAALMMQNGAEMSAEDGSPTFGLIPAALSGQREEPPAYQALSFYTDFANQNKEVYTWNAKMPASLDAFIQGKSAFFFGYSYHLPTIRARAPKLNLGISTLPQIQNNPVVNFANYWAWTVSKKTKSVDIAWNLINFMRTPDESKIFLDAAKRPAALRSQLGAQLENEDIGVFASQVLTAKSWYRGDDPKAADDAFVELIDTAIGLDTEKYPQAVNIAVDKISQTIPYGGI
ncbi:MAG: extracellular solute-binding protein [Patescibacteria group bacterium]|nr:extracellular solute-binding protein [Patescibacteria group bacterium]